MKPRNKFTLAIQGEGGFEHCGVVEVDEELLKEIRNSKESFEKFKFTTIFSFKVKKPNEEIRHIPVSIRNIYELN